MVLATAIAVLCCNILFKKLKFATIESSSTNCASQEFYGSADVIFEDSHADSGLFTTGLTVHASAKGSDFITVLSA